jgi:hypothetical protein
MSSKKLSQQAFVAGKTSALRSRLLGGTALTVCAFGLAGTASANDLTFNGANALTNLIGGLWYIPVSGTTVANVNTADLNTTLGLNAIWVAQVGLAGTQNITVGSGRSVTGYNAIIATAVTDTINIANSGTLTAAANGIYAQNTISGDITVTGPGTTTASAGNGMWLLTPSGAVNVGTAATPIGAATGSLNGIVINNPGSVGPSPINVNATSATGTAGYGIWTVGGTGNQAISTTGPISGLTGQYLNSTTGNIVANGNGTSTTTGTLGQGITIGTATGNMTVQNYSAITGTATGAWLVGTTGSANVTNNGAITGTAVDGVLVGTTTGAVNVNNNGPVTGVNGIVTVGGPTAVNNNGAITGTGGVGVLTTTVDGTQSINGNGPITGTALQGIAATSVTGAIGIGDTAFNGVITGATNGIQAISNAAIGGNINVSTNANVTGTGNIGILTSTSGNTVNNITAGNVTGGVWGMDTLAQGMGNITNNIAAGSIVQGGVTGLVEGTILGTSTTNNLGLIRSTTDTGAAGTAGGSALVTVAGINVVNNTGQIVGRVDTAGLATTINNAAGGVWTPGIGGNAFGALNDTVNNAGVINVRTGTTAFNGLENLNNVAGGNINLAYGGAAATDNLVVLGFRPQVGSSVTLNFNATAANNAALGFDNTPNGLGTADTIVVAGAATPQARSTINLISQGTPTSLTGSVALIYTGVNLVAPTVGANLTQSVNYQFGAGSNPSNGRTIYYLVDDGNGGVYLQWKPNTSAAALAGFGGAFGKAGAGGGSAGAAIGGAAGGSAGVGGVGLGGGPTGGGAAGQVADLAAGADTGGGSGGSSYNGGSLKDGGSAPVASCGKPRSILGWGALEGERSKFSGGGGSSSSLTGGVDFEASAPMRLGCGNRLGFGFFGSAGNASSYGESGTSNSDSTGVGAYVRATSVTGLYASLLGAVNWSDAKLMNAVYGSFADKNTKSVTAAGAIGYVARINKATSIDFRAFASKSRNKADPFTDTVGISVTESTDEIFTYGGSIGIKQALTASVQGFLRAGIKKSELDSSMTVFGTSFSGSTTGVARSIEGGLIGDLGRGATLGVSGYGTRSDGTTGYGGRAHLGIKF